jgi:hypothetical protein
MLNQSSKVELMAYIINVQNILRVISNAITLVGTCTHNYRINREFEIFVLVATRTGISL